SPDAYGSLVFDGRFTGDSFADFLLGVPDMTNVFTPRPETSGRYDDMGLYVQDKWAVTPAITVTYGVRNDFWTIPHDARNLYFNFDPATGSLVVPNSAALQYASSAWPQNIPIVTAQQAGFPERLRNISHLNLSPRLAVAWRPSRSDKTAIRAGYGIYHDPLT